MILPDKVSILGKTYDIQYKDFDKSVQCNGLLGSAFYSKQMIQIDNSVSREVQESTLIHEVLHLISDSLLLEFDEKTIKQLETGVYQVLNDNGFLKCD